MILQLHGLRQSQEPLKAKHSLQPSCDEEASRKREVCQSENVLNIRMLLSAFLSQRILPKASIYRKDERAARKTSIWTVTEGQDEAGGLKRVRISGVWTSEACSPHGGPPGPHTCRPWDCDPQGPPLTPAALPSGWYLQTRFKFSFVS